MMNSKERYDNTHDYSFYFPPKRKRNYQRMKEFPHYSMENEDFGHLRHVAYRHCFTRVEEIADSILTAANQKCLEEIRLFLKEKNRFSEFRTAIVFGGVNVSDTEVILTKWATQLSTDTSLIMSLRSKDCGDNARSIFQSCVNQLNARNIPLRHERRVKSLHALETKRSTSSLRESSKSLLSKMKKSLLDSHVHCHDHCHVHRQEERDAEKHRKEEEDEMKDSSTFTPRCPTILKNDHSDPDNDHDHEEKKFIFIFQDYDCFSENAIQDFLEIIKDENFPALFIFGTSSPSSNSFRRMKYGISCHLHMKKFYLLDAINCMNLIAKALVVDGNLPIQISGRVFEWLRTTHFLSSSFSVKSFIRDFQFILMEHFYNVPFSFLCLPNYHCDSLKAKIGCQEGMDDIFDLLDEQHIEFLRNRLGSLKKIYKKNSLTCQDIRHFCHQIKTWRLVWASSWRCFEIAHNVYLKFKNVKGSLNLLLPDCMDGKLTSTDTFQEVLLVIQSLDLEASYMLVKKWLSCLLQTTKESSFHNGQIRVEEIEFESSHYQTEITKLDEFIDLFTFLLNDGESMGQESEEIRKHLMLDISSFFVQLIETHLVSIKHFEMHELFLYDRTLELEKALFAQQQVSIVTALKHHERYLKCKCSGKDHQLDICTLYATYDSNHHVIDINEWYNDFKATQHQCHLHPFKETALEENENTVKARFLRSTATLHALGFIRSVGKNGKIVKQTMMQ